MNVAWRAPWTAGAPARPPRASRAGAPAAAPRRCPALARAQSGGGGGNRQHKHGETAAAGAQQQQQQQQEGAAGLRRREVLLRASLAPALVPLVIGSDDATTILNSVLSGYGLPTLKASEGFKAYDEFEAPYYFEYPKAWVGRANSLRPGLYVSNFQTADKASVEELDLPPGADATELAVGAAVVPGGAALGQADARLAMPPKKLIKSSAATIDGQEYLYLEFPSETVTQSGYQIQRRNFVVAAAKRGKLYVLAASARGDQYNEAKRELLARIVASFRLR